MPKPIKIAYFDCSSGISGDMVLGAMIDLGLDIKILRGELSKLPITNYSLSAVKDERHSITGTNFKVKLQKPQHSTTFKHIKNLINKSKLSDKVKRLSTAIFLNLAKAEAKIHGTNINDVHFHEVGAVDSIVDIVGTAIGIEYLGLQRIYSSALPLGSGWVSSSHGRMPVPAPATLELLKSAVIVSSIVASELTTPTGAAIIKSLVKDFGSMPGMKVENIGYGIGDKDFREIPNALRIVIGENSGCLEKLLVIETNIDDMNPQIYDYLMTRLLKKDALDVFLTPIIMKKNRPAILLKVLCDGKNKDSIINTIFKETTTVGIRTYEVNRYCLERDIKQVSTAYGKVRVKFSQRNGQLINIQPEYDDCKKIAQKLNVPLKKVMDSAKIKFKVTLK